ncbi:hypothetical protein CVT24_006119 [Panaeolus cyanescens]|uniref:PUA domain-containing protein n=1 Tax=Panaeolus cyanescens TaxID=181874 RepID=A0A409V8U2_9AGAR|nr:hypothetical protein CVT24_006119 [Panaeolus cyanescens]
MGSASGRSTPHPVAQTLNTQFDENVSFVRRYAGRVEKEIVSPAFQYGQSAFENRPLSTLLLGIFLTLSVIPILLFALAVICTTVSLISVAVGAALLASFAISLGFFSILATTLTGTIFVSLLLTLGIVGIFLLSKLLYLAWSDGPEGVHKWFYQTKQQFMHTFGYTRQKAVLQPSPDYTPQMHDSGIAFTIESNHESDDAKSSMRLGISVARPNLVSLGTCFGKFSKSGKFKLHITALDYLAQYAKYKVWIKPNGEMPFLYGNHVLKAHLGRITEDTPEHQGVVVYSMNDIPLGFGVTARSTVDTRKLDPTAILVFHQADVGEYLRDEDTLF